MTDDTTPTSDFDGDPPPSGVIDLAAQRRARGLPVGSPEPEKVVSDAELAPADKACRHVKVFVNIDTHVVSCGDCQDELDPVVVLHQYAVRERQLRSGDIAKTTEHKRLAAEIDALKRERRNLKAGIGRDELVKKLANAEAWARKEALATLEMSKRYRALHTQLVSLGKKPSA